MRPEQHQNFNLAVAILPFLALLVAIVLLWQSLVTTLDIGLLVVMYTLTTLGITLGFHRLLTHRSFETRPWVRNTLAVLGSMAGQGPPIIWVADHRKHHGLSDRPGDPHSPHLQEGTGLRATLRGLWHAHMGWIFSLERDSEPVRYAREMVRDPVMRKISANFVPLVLLGLAIPALIGFAVTQSAKGALTGLLWGGLVRLFFTYHMTFSVNSIGHSFGRKRFDVADESRNVWWLALPSLGECWHNNHHAFPRSARAGLRWWEMDLLGLLIRGMSRVGLAWEIATVPPEVVKAREIPR